ncbi:MAG: response regulator, partial [Pseudomonadales bacterium]|nr:response regulator [Pseudomonadales bacterium]
MKAGEMGNEMSGADGTGGALPASRGKGDAVIGADNSMFLANMSHEIRTPMNTILGYAQILSREAALSSTHKQNLDSIILSARHLLSLINDVLDISRVECGRMEVVESVFDVYVLFDTVDAVARNKLEEKQLGFAIDISQRVPRHIRADESKFRQIVVNLVSNAVKYTQTGKVNVEVDVDTSNRLSVTVSDTGPGIPADDLEKVFLPFERSSSNSETQEGTGLGLAISKQFARLLGGDITVASTVGVGSEFRLTIPVHIDSASEDVDVAPTSRSRVIGIKGSARRILIVDDNRENALLSGQFLSSIGFEVEVVFSGDEGIDAARRFRPQLILMDKRMPDMDGLEATRVIKQETTGQAPIVIVVSASAFHEEGQESIDEGADGYIRKPYLEDELLKEISRLTGV